MTNERQPRGAISKPIFLIGSGRSGTTIVFRLLYGHSHCAYVSNLSDYLPGLPQLAALSRVPGLRAYKPFQPSLEAIRTFEYCGISDEQLLAEKRSFTEHDVAKNEKDRLRKIVRAHARWQCKPRFINKNTSNTMRVRYLREIFPDALFIHVIRNCLGVVNSLINVDWWLDLNLWWLGQTPRQWQEMGGDPYELAALHWKRQVEVALEAAKHIPKSQYFECRYEDLLGDPKHEVRKILDFCELEWDDEFDRHYDRIAVRTGNGDKWRGRFDSVEIKTILESSGDLLTSLGYETPVADK